MNEMYSLIENLCKTRKINITQMCKQLGIPRSVFSELKAGRTKTLSGKYIAPIAEYFNVSTDYLLTGEQEEKPTTKSGGLGMNDFEYALRNEISKLTDENKQKLLEMAQFFQQQQNKE